MGLPPITDEEVEAATSTPTVQKICLSAISSRTSVCSGDHQQEPQRPGVVKAPGRRLPDVAQDMLNIQKAKLTGDYLHTSAIIVGEGPGALGRE